MGAEQYYQSRVGHLYKRPINVKLQATFSSGVATLDTANSDPEVTIAKDVTGDYDITFPKGKRVHPAAMFIDLASDTPADTVSGYAQPRSLSASAGTGKVLFFNRDDGDQADPPDGARLYLTLEVETG